MREKLQRAWASASLCLIASLLACLGGGALLLGAVHEIYGGDNPACTAVTSTCTSPKGFAAVAFTAAGLVLFALGATAWFRALKLVAGTRRGRQRAA